MIWNPAYYWSIPAEALHRVAAVLLVAIYVDDELVLENARWGGADRGALAWHAAETLPRWQALALGPFGFIEA